MNIYTDASQLIGRTPLLRLTRLEQKWGLQAQLLVKLEGKNPAGSVKDRVAVHMIAKAERRGELKPGATIVEPTSGNTGIGLAAVGAAKGYQVILTMPESMSKERRQLLAAYGAQLVLTPASAGMQGAVDRARELAAQIPGAWMACQFENPDNSAAHRLTTGPEIWQDTDGAVDVLVAGVGTGGTISGAGGWLKSRKPSLYVAAVEPAASPLLSQGKAGPHGLQGIGANFVPQVLERNVIDEILPVTEQEAYAAGRALARTEGVLAGISSGAALAAAAQIARRPAFSGAVIVVILPDGGEKYLSTPMFEEE